MSTKFESFMYVGETRNLRRVLREDNNASADTIGRGSRFLRPFAVIEYIGRFEDSNLFLQHRRECQMYWQWRQEELEEEHLTSTRGFEPGG